MIGRITVLSGMLIFTMACSEGEHTHQGVLLHETLKQAQQNHNETWRQQRTEIEFQSGATANNCADYTREIKLSNVS